MSARKCNACGATTDNDEATSCPVCGAKLPPAASRDVVGPAAKLPRRGAGRVGNGADVGAGAAPTGKANRRVLAAVGLAAVVGGAVAFYFFVHRPGAQQAACVSTCMECVGGGQQAMLPCTAGCATPGRAECFAGDQTCAGLSRCELRARFGEGAATGSRSCRDTMDCLFKCGSNHDCDVGCVADAGEPTVLNGAIACVLINGAQACAAGNPTYQQCLRQ